MDTAEDDELRLRAGRGLLGEFEGISCDVGELDHFVALVVVAQDEQPVAECLLGRPGSLNEIRVGRGG